MVTMRLLCSTREEKMNTIKTSAHYFQILWNDWSVMQLRGVKTLEVGLSGVKEFRNKAISLFLWWCPCIWFNCRLIWWISCIRSSNVTRDGSSLRCSQPEGTRGLLLFLFLSLSLFSHFNHHFSGCDGWRDDTMEKCPPSPSSECVASFCCHGDLAFSADWVQGVRCFVAARWCYETGSRFQIQTFPPYSVSAYDSSKRTQIDHVQSNSSILLLNKIHEMSTRAVCSVGCIRCIISAFCSRYYEVLCFC